MTESSMQHHEPTARPASVGTAVKLMYAALGMDIYSFLHYRSRILEIIAEPGLRYWISFGIACIFMYGFLLLLIFRIGGGKNWARTIYLVLYILTILSFPMFMKHYPQLFSNSPNLGILTLVQVVVQGIALVLVFKRDTSAWFKTMKQARADFSMHR